MKTTVLWRRLTETDFNAMNGQASPFGRGGGAMHIALGVKSSTFPIHAFLNASNRPTVTINASGHAREGESGPLTFSSNPHRRHGEWLIRDQYSNRHPAWSPAAGFPNRFDARTPPYVLVFRVGNRFFARFADLGLLRKLGTDAILERMRTESKGIAPAPEALVLALDVPTETLVDSLGNALVSQPTEPFDPSDRSDGRRRVLAAIVRRLGQTRFRRRLLVAYEGRCALTRCSTEWVLEAAHITPYRGARTNSLANGLLLRADVHTLFDLALISIEPSIMRIRVSKRIAWSPYLGLSGKQPRLPTLPESRPSQAALWEHFRTFSNQDQTK